MKKFYKRLKNKIIHTLIHFILFNKMNINQDWYNEIDEELKIKYQTFVGVNPTDVSINRYTMDEQIERYAKNYAFWLLERPEIINLINIDTKTATKSFIVSNALKNMLKMIQEKFDEEIQRKITYRANDIFNEHK